ncbi:retrovirus-related pol polyprotein from transposon TNT 1-94 [Tanacetum coccineum]|uniref:Retrovirus-related pol polyprotein from transposon TNT 1-94 n=1 Tax=Tanacetum coccineum TaxID=301880 RepID=A0ABQ5J6R7_9ASTR
MVDPEYQGSTNVILQSFRRDFETASMKGNESVQEYLAKVSSIVSQMRSYGEKITDETIVARVFILNLTMLCLQLKSQRICQFFSFDELMVSLQAHEARINRNIDKEEEKAFQIKGEPETSNQRLRGRGRLSFRGRGRGHGRNITLHCTNCNKYGHTGIVLGFKIPRRRFPIEGDASEGEEYQRDTKSPMVLFAGDPISVQEALVREEWKNAMQEELRSIEKNQTWELSDLPEGKTPIGLKWIFKTKYFADGSIQKYKARLVVRGFIQQAGIDYEETFSPPGFEDSKNPNKVLKLRKALYELKQAPRAWYSKIDVFFHKEGFESSHEPTLYVKKQGTTDFMIVSFYVEDMIYTGSSLQLTSEFKQSMMNTFDMTNLGKLHYFLGLNIVQGKTVCTPMNIGEKLQHEDGTEAADGTMYRSLIGRSIYLTHSRPDISFSVGLLSRFMHKPSKHHLGAAKRVLRYLADSDWAGSVEDRKSTSGSCFILGKLVVSWSSKKQATVALSSTKAEYVAANAAAC